MPGGTDGPDLRLISWNITLRCPLRCAHCYVNASEHEAEGVLSTDEAYAVIDQICEMGRPVVILSGGEPLMRDDIFRIARYGTKKGLVMAMGTSGVLIDETCAREIRDSGIRKVAISIDSADPSVHDSFRGLAGAWDRAVQGIRHCVNEGIGVQINTTVLSPDIQAIKDVVSLGTGLGVSDYQLFFPVPTGRGNDVPWLTPQVYEDLIREVLVAYKDTDVNIRPTCAPQFRRIADTLGIRNPAWGRGCIAGISYCRIFADGDVTPCPYLPARAGNVRESPLETIWHESPVFLALRDVSLLTGKCGRCGYREVCGGCRARSYATGGTMTDMCGGIAWPADPAGDLCGEDPWCRYEPEEKATAHAGPADEKDLALLDALQDDIPLVSRPYDEIAARLDIPADEVMERLRGLQERGIVRGLSPVLESRQVGLTATTLVALRVPEEKIRAVTRLINAYPEVSHNYRRDHAFPLWFTVAGKDEGRIREIVEEIRQRAGLSDEDILELPTVRRFKIDVRFSFPGIPAPEAGNGPD
ncbi:MAG: radical SAM protein [Methanoregula sp.]|uniref:radical SAM protein n=1 Tax=Methanoregula sp. TaxID=2052170 RepID=UPI003BAED648